jgi:DNA modification methylase
MGADPMTTTTKMELVDIGRLIPYINNARTHSPEQITKLRSSLREFGFINPILVDKDYNILAGHGRLAAAKEEGLTKIPCVFVEHLTDAQKKAYIIADNRMAMDAGWDNDLLRVELEALQGEDFNVLLTGFDESELSKLFDEGNAAKEDDFNVDAELEKPCFSKLGDIWRLGRHSVICGDSTDPDTFKALLGDTKVNLVCTDAPYFVDLKNKSGSIANDNLNDKEAYAFLMKVFANFKEAMAKDASIYEFYATMKTRVFYDAFEDAGFKVGAGLVWKKPRAPLMRTDWKFNMEPIIWGWRKDGKHIWYGDQKQTSVFEFDGIKDSKTEGFGHPSSKPVPLIAYLIQQCTQSNGLVLDGFLGSASTLIACEQIGRVCYGVELEPKFVDVAVERFRSFNPDAEIFVERNGETIPYDKVEKLEVNADEG